MEAAHAAQAAVRILAEDLHGGAAARVQPGQGRAELLADGRRRLEDRGRVAWLGPQPHLGQRGRAGVVPHGRRPPLLGPSREERGVAAPHGAEVGLDGLREVSPPGGPRGQPLDPLRGPPLYTRLNKGIHIYIYIYIYIYIQRERDIDR